MCTIKDDKVVEPLIKGATCKPSVRSWKQRIVRRVEVACFAVMLWLLTHGRHLSHSLDVELLVRTILTAKDVEEYEVMLKTIPCLKLPLEYCAVLS